MYGMQVGDGNGEPIVDRIFLARMLYVAGSVLFIFGLKLMSHPRTAVRGNLLGALGMLLAIVVVLTGWEAPQAHRMYYALPIVGALMGAVIGVVAALFTRIEAMPQLVALFNGFGGLASALVAGGALLEGMTATDALVATAASGIIGAVTFSGSCIAFAKLQEIRYFKRPVSLPFQHAITGGLGLLLLLMGWALAGGSFWIYVPLVIVSLVLGVLLVNPIGGADMPVVIALLNSYSGLAAAATGFVIDNYVLIISGSLVGASGIILTRIMCRAMNRSLTNVLFGVMDASRTGATADDLYATVRSTSAEEVAMLLESAQRVVIIPGYGLAVAQAQRAVRELQQILEQQGKTVEYAIHPVAGRMPGHMNVLLAEADVEYDKLREMDDINPTMDTVDVAIVLGANDVVNPLARTDPNCPIAGMPIIDADKARTVVVIKRSLSPGFAGIPNPLFAMPNTLMYFEDGQKAVRQIIAALKEMSS
ncbi:MAG: NAD(P) transhydrogenase subunit beta [Pirellulaceae bacterium]|nr:MAG: NAD(P) transhydrogenase subunit beta [Pirellulaceae bacterium]